MRTLEDGCAKLSIERASSGRSQLAAIDDGAKAGSRSASGYGMSPLPK